MHPQLLIQKTLNAFEQSTTLSLFSRLHQLGLAKVPSNSIIHASSMHPQLPIRKTLDAFEQSTTLSLFSRLYQLGLAKVLSNSIIHASSALSASHPEDD